MFSGAKYKLIFSANVKFNSILIFNMIIKARFESYKTQVICLKQRGSLTLIIYHYPFDNQNQKARRQAA